MGDVSCAAAAGGVGLCCRGGVVGGLGVGFCRVRGGWFKGDDGGGGEGAGAVADAAAAEGEVVRVGRGGFVDCVGHFGWWLLLLVRGGVGGGYGCGVAEGFGGGGGLFCGGSLGGGVGSEGVLVFPVELALEEAFQDEGVGHGMGFQTIDCM